MRKSIIRLATALLFLPFGVLLPARAAEITPSIKNVPTAYSAEVVSNGRYTNWAGVSSVSQFVDHKGHFCFAADEGERVTVYRTEQGEITGSVSIENPWDSFGTAVCGGDGSLYMVWGRDNKTDDTSVPTIIVGRYAADGIMTGEAHGNGSEGMAWYYDEGFYTKTPFDGGNCDAAVSGNLLMVNYARHMYGGHQSNTVFVVDTGTMEVKTGFSSYNSHSFDQRVTAYEKTGGFLVQSQGDCFPRGFVTALTDDTHTLGEMLTFNFWVEPDAYRDYDMWKLNATRARLGNILETSQGAALVASSARSLSEEAKTEPYDVFVQVFHPDGREDSADSYVTQGTRSGLAGNNGDREVTDYGVCWLTDLAGSGKTADVVQAVSIDGDRIAVLYELYDDYGYDSTWCMLLNGDGSVCLDASSLGKVRLNTDEDPVYADGAVQWVSNAAGSDNLVLHSLVFRKGDAVPSGTFGPEGELSWTMREGCVSVTGPVSADSPVAAACYGNGGVMLGLELVDQPGGTAAVRENAAFVKLFWLDTHDSAWVPVCTPAEIPIEG